MDATALLTQPLVSEEFAGYGLHNHEGRIRSGESDGADSAHIQLTAKDSSMTHFLSK